MAVDSSPAANQDKSPDPGIPVVADGVVDPLIGKPCHQCRQKIKTSGVTCKNLRKNKPCTLNLCKRCLLNRYGETVEAVAASEKWSCPKCNGICNCSVCMKSRGYRPTGPLSSKAKDKSYSSVSEMLIKEPEFLDREKVGEAVVDCPQNEEGAISPTKSKVENSSDGLMDTNRSDSVVNSSKKAKQAQKKSCKKAGKKEDTNSCDKKAKKIMCDEAGEIGNDSDEVAEDSEVAPEITLPVGKELTTVAGIELPAKDIGNALQFLEFFQTFGQLLVVRQGLPEQVVQDLFHGRTARRGRYSLTVQLHVQLLSELQPEDEETGEESPDDERSPWFQKLKDCLSETHKTLKIPVLESLEKAADYEDLDASEKLMILNILCDELLGTAKLRNFIENENTDFHEKVKEARNTKRKLMKKAKIVTEETKNVTEEAVIQKDGNSITISEQAEASSDKSVAAQDNANVVDSIDKLLLKDNPTCGALRTGPFFVDPRGHAYWKLGVAQHEILVQDIGRGDGTSSFDEKWSVLDAEEKEVVENHVRSVKNPRKKRKLSNI